MYMVPDIKLGRYSRSITQIKFSSVRRLYRPFTSRGHERNILSNIMLLTIFMFFSAIFLGKLFSYETRLYSNFTNFHIVLQ